MTSRLSQQERFQEAIDILKRGRLSLLTALIKVLHPWLFVMRMQLCICIHKGSANRENYSTGSGTIAVATLN